MLCESRIPILSALLGVVGEGVAVVIVTKCEADTIFKRIRLLPLDFKRAGSFASQQRKAVSHG